MEVSLCKYIEVDISVLKLFLPFRCKYSALYEYEFDSLYDGDEDDTAVVVMK